MTPDPSDAPSDAEEATPADDAAGEPGGGPSGRRRRRRLLLLAVLALLVVWAAVAAVKVFSAYGHAQDGLAVMEDVRGRATEDMSAFVSSVSGSREQTKEVSDQLAVAGRSFESARSDVDSPILAPLRILPVVGRQLRSVSALSGAAATTATRSGTAFSELSDEAAAPANTPEERLAALGRIQGTLVTLRKELTGLDLGPDEGLLGPLERSRASFATDYDRTLDTLGRAADGVTGVDAFLKGPSTYLVLAANNAEMRAGSGMYLQIGTLTVDQGRFTLSEFTSLEDQVLPRPGATVDPDIQNLWGWLLPNQEWRNLNLSPRFEESARMASEMWAASGRGPVDGVIAIDVVGLQRLLEVTGPVQVSDGASGTVTIDAGNVRRDLLVEQYKRYGNEKDPRRERLGRVGAAVFQAFNERPVPATDLVKAFQEAGAGRNLLLWSSDPTEQAAWKALGTAGTLPRDALMVSVLNRGGNKLDQFLKVDAALSAVTSGPNRRVTVQVTMKNDSPTGKEWPTYVVGPYPKTDYQRGEYVGILELTIPEGGGNPTSTGADLYRTGNDGPTRVLTAAIRIPSGQTSTVTFQFDLPTSWKQVEVMPSARVPAVTWSVGNQSWSDRKPRTVVLEPRG